MTPASEFGWEYEAINYDIEDDARRLRERRGTSGCAPHEEPPGSEVVTSDGIRIAGWFIPAANDIGPGGPTIVLVHGLGGSKGDMLSIAEILHDRYNLVLLDLRNHGQSTGTHTTVGVREQEDVRAILDWLEREKDPERIGLFGSSMGGATVVNVARDDPRVDAVALDSTHASLRNTVEARLRNQSYPLTLPGYWAVVVATWVRTGVWVPSADPLEAVDELGERPLLIVQGGRDRSHGPGNAEELLAAAQDGGVSVELYVCPEGGHGGLRHACPEEYPGWVLDFFDRALARTSASD